MAFALTPQLCGLSSQRLAQLGKLGLTGCSGLEEWSLCPHWTGEQTGLRGAHNGVGPGLPILHPSCSLAPPLFAGSVWAVVGPQYPP